MARAGGRPPGPAARPSGPNAPGSNAAGSQAPATGQRRTRLHHRWNQVGTSPYPWEQEGLDHIKRLLPDAEPYRAWATFSFTAASGRINECDLLIAVPNGLHLLELKAHPGRVVNYGRTWTITEPGGRARTLDNPLHLTDAKSKDLRSRLEWAARQLKLTNFQVPRVQPAVFLSASGLDSRLDEVQSAHVYGRDGASRGLPTIWADLLSRPPERPNWRVTPDVSQKIGELLGVMGVAASSAHLKFGDDWTLHTDVLDAGPTWEDRLADRKGLVEEQGRVRIYLTALQAGDAERRSVERAARREYQVLQGITHPGIAQALDLRMHGGGPAILFRHRASDLRLDAYLDVHAERLTPALRLDLVRQLAEAVRYAHGRSLYHRALAARSVYVSAKDDGSSPLLRIIDWQSAARDPDTTLPTSISISSQPGQHTGDADVYLAPEVGEPFADPADLDVFGLGAVSYLILTGEPPAANRPALLGRLTSEGGLHLFAASDAVSPELDDLVHTATRADVNERLESAEEFLLFLDTPEKQVAEVQPQAAGADPLTALPGDELPGGWVVLRVLGTGSTARALLVESTEERAEGVEPRRQVLKVALDDVKAQRLQSEAQALTKVGGGCIIRRYDGPRQLGACTVIDLEFAGEQSLGAQLRSEGRLSYHDLERFGGDLFSALHELAAHGVRHRDIKPDNLGIQIRADRSRQLKLFDFSLADVPDRDITVGTRGYLDPFIGSDRRPAYDDQAERYAAAVTLYEMATGTRLEWDFGGVAPIISDVELPQLAADLFEPDLREGLTAFFRRALHRDVDRRFDTLDQLEAAWHAVFTAADAALPASTPATADLGSSAAESTDAADAAAIEAAREEAARAATLQTTLDAAGLSPRAVSVAHGLAASTVGELIAVPLHQISRARGTGNRVRKELIRRHRQWTAALLAQAPAPDAAMPPVGSVPAADVELGTGWVPSVDELAHLLNPPASGRRSRRPEVVRALLGLIPGVPAWPTQSEVATALDLAQGTVSRFYKEALTGWGADPLLAGVRAELVETVVGNGRLMTATELARALRARRGCRAGTPEEELALALAVVRAAVDVEQRADLPGRLPAATGVPEDSGADADQDDDEDGSEDAQLGALRRGGTVWIAAESMPGTDDPVPTELVEYAAALGVEAARLAGEDPLPGRAAVLRALREQRAPDGLALLPETRLVELAAAAAPTPVAVSSRLELYPHDLALDRALRISQAPAGARHDRGVTVPELVARVRSRFPDIRLPDPLTYVTVEVALQAADFDLRYDTVRAAFLAPEPVVPSSSVTATTLGPGGTPRLLPAGDIPALAKLADGVERGGFVAVTVRGGRLPALAARLARRYPVATLDLDALFLQELRALAAERGTAWNLLLAGDGELAEAGVAGRAFGSYLRATWKRVTARVPQAYGPGQVLLVHDAGLLGRYWDDGGHGLLVALQASARRPGEGPHGLWLLCPGDSERETPRLGGHIVEVLGDHEVAALDRATVEQLGSAAA